MASQFNVSLPRIQLSLLGDSQSVRMYKNCKKELGGFVLDTSCTLSGWNTSQLRTAVKEKAGVLVNNCFIFIGVNDILKKVPMKDTVNNIKSIIKILHRHHKRILIATLPPILNSISQQEEQIRSLNVHIQSFGTHPAVTIVPFHKLFPPFSALKLEYYQQRYYSGRKDNVHLSARGLRAMVDLIISKL